MTKEKLNEILNLSRDEKIELVQTLWDDISSKESTDEISPEHKQLLDETLQRIEEGKTQFSQWGEVRVKYGKQK
jgi:putative addiction module component (TIGR02574 family)